jgi:hypothetical protein
VRIEPAKSPSKPLAPGPEVFGVSSGGTQRDLFSHPGANPPLPALELGQELEAFIVEELGQGRLLLKIGTALIQADNPGGLNAGQSVRVRVDQLQPQVVLHVIEVEPTLEAEAVRLLRSHLPPGSGSGELLSFLQDQLRTMLDQPLGSAEVLEKLAKLSAWIEPVLAGGIPPVPDTLRALVRDGGLFYEAKLFAAAANGTETLLEIANDDLKGLLLAALASSRTEALPPGLQHALAAQVDHLEGQQAMNLLAQLNGGAIQIQIPFLAGSVFSTATLTVEPDGQRGEGKDGSGKSGYSLLFMLDLENFGATRIDAYINEQELRAVFFVETQASLEAIRHELPALRGTLLALGYSNIHLAAKPLRELPPDKQEKFAALAAGAPSSIHLLDMKA